MGSAEAGAPAAREPAAETLQASARSRRRYRNLERSRMQEALVATGGDKTRARRS